MKKHLLISLLILIGSLGFAFRIENHDGSNLDGEADRLKLGASAPDLMGSPNIIRVPADHLTIQAAVNAAQDNDIILVADGNYTENIEVNKSLHIRSENGANTTFVLAESSSRHVFTIKSNYTTIEGFTITGATGTDRSGIYSDGTTNLTIVSNNVSSNYDGIVLEAVANPNVTDNVADSNKEYGIRVGAVHNNTCITIVSGNTAQKNGANGIVVSERLRNGTLSITNNWLEGNGGGLEYASIKSRFEESGYGHDTISGNIIISNSDVGLAISLVSTNYIITITGNNISRNGAGMVIEGMSTGGHNVTGNIICHNAGPGINGSWVNSGFNSTDYTISALFDNNTIEHNDGGGLVLTSIRSGGGIPVTNNRVNYNNGSGILMAGIKSSSPCPLEDNVIEFNSGVGIELVGLKIGSENPIARNVIHSNGGRPDFLNLAYWEDLLDNWAFIVDDWDLGREDIGRVGALAIISTTSEGYPIVDNILEFNNGTGIYICGTSLSNGTIEGNKIGSNLGDGLWIYDSLIGNGTIGKNLIRDNLGAGIGIGSRLDDLSLQHDIISNDVLNNSVGVIQNRSAGSVIAHNLILDNGRHGVYIREGSYNTIWNNTILGNMWGSNSYDESYAGIYAWGETDLNITNNNVSSNYNGIVVDRGSDVWVTNNIVDHSEGYGIDVDVIFIGEYILSGNTARNNGNAGISLVQKSAYGKATVTDNWLEGNTGGLGYVSKKGEFPDQDLHVDVISRNTIIFDSVIGLALSYKHGCNYATEVDGNNVSHNAFGLLISDKSGGGSVVRHNSICHNDGPGVMGSWHNGGFNSTDYWVQDPVDPQLGYADDYERDWLGVLFQNNTVEYNNGPGLALMGLSNGGAVPVVGNRINYNNGSGILMPAASDSGPNPIEDNVICYNKGMGVEMLALRNGGLSPIARNNISYNEASAVLLDVGRWEINQDLIQKLGYADEDPDFDYSIDDFEYLLDYFEYEDLEIGDFGLGSVGGIILLTDSSGGYPIVDNVIDGNGGSGISILSSKSGGGTIRGNQIRENLGSGVSILVSKSYSGGISSNVIEGNQGDGVWIYLSRAGHRIVANNSIKDNAGAGLFLGAGIQNGYEVLNNSFVNNSVSLYLNGSLNISISDNIMAGGMNGLVVRDSANNSVTRNLIWDTAGHGVRIDSGSLTKIWNNTLLRNNGATDVYDVDHVQAFDLGTGNQWNNSGNPHGWGNYWGDWTSPDADGDGIVDEPYVIDSVSGAKDYYPLSQPSVVLVVPPQPPTNLSAIGGPGLVELSWELPINDGGGKVLLFTIYRGNETERSYLTKVGPDSNNFTDFDVEPCVRYYYHVTANNSAGESAPSEVSGAVPGYIHTIPIVSITSPLNGSFVNALPIDVGWVGDGNGSDIVGYELRLDSGNWLDVGLDTSRSFSNLDDGVYTVDVRAFNTGGGNSSASVSFWVDTTPPHVTITHPEDGWLTNTTCVLFQWEGEDVVSGIDGFTVRFDQGSWENVAMENSFERMGISEGSHIFKVMAMDKAGNDVTSLVNFTVDTTPPNVVSYTPTGGGIPVDTNVTVEFSEEIVTTSVYIMIDGLSGILDWDNCMVVFVPRGNLSEGTTYAVSLQGKDLAGNSLEDFEWSFTTRMKVVEVVPVVMILILVVGLGLVDQILGPEGDHACLRDR